MVFREEIGTVEKIFVMEFRVQAKGEKKC